MRQSCDQLQGLLVDYAVQQLAADQSARIEQHLAKCAHCRDMLVALQRSLDVAQVIWRDNLPLQTPHHTAGVVSGTRWRYWATGPAIAAAVALVVGLAALFHLGRPAATPTSAPLPVTLVQIERAVQEGYSAARVKAAEEICAEPDDELREQYRYLITASLARTKTGQDTSAN